MTDEMQPVVRPEIPLPVLTGELANNEKTGTLRPPEMFWITLALWTMSFVGYLMS